MSGSGATCVRCEKSNMISWHELVQLMHKFDLSFFSNEMVQNKRKYEFRT